MVEAFGSSEGIRIRRRSHLFRVRQKQPRCCWSNWNRFGLKTLAVSCRSLRKILSSRCCFSLSLRFLPALCVCASINRGEKGSCDVLCFNLLVCLPSSLTLPLRLPLLRLVDNNRDFVKAKLKLQLNASCYGPLLSPFPAHLCSHSSLGFLKYV